jgi:hypothetical protein
MEIISLYNRQFSWDRAKNIKNITKHNVSFKEAAGVFDDVDALYEYDKIHSQDEERFKVLGKSKNSRILLVVYCEREHNNSEVIRIVSAWQASDEQSQKYEAGGIN